MKVFDDMLHREYITPVQWQAATLLYERVAASRAQRESYLGVSTVEAPDAHTASEHNIFDRLFIDPEPLLLKHECLESLAKIIAHNLDSLVESYGLEELPDPRAILRRQVRIGI